jgi:hypothetical protein
MTVQMLVPADLADLCTNDVHGLLLQQHPKYITINGIAAIDREEEEDGVKHHNVQWNLGADLTTNTTINQ